MKIIRQHSRELLILGLLVFTLALGQLQRLPVPWGAQYVHELVLFFFLFVKRQAYVRVLMQAWKKTARSGRILVALTIGGVLLHWCTSGESRAVLLTMRAFLYSSTALVVYQTLANRRKQVLRLCLLASGVAMAVTGILQYLFLPDVRFLSLFGWDDHYFRAIGSMLDPNYLGIVVLLTLANLWTWSNKLPPKLLGGVTILLSLTLAATLSRATFLTTGGFFGLQFLQSRRAKAKLLNLQIIIATVVIICTVIVIPKPTGEGVDLLRTSSIVSRITHDQVFLQSHTFDPIKILFGSGVFSSPRQSSETDSSRDHGLQANNFFVFLYQGLGLVGSALLIPFLIRGGRAIHQNEPIIAFVLVGIFIHAQFNNSFFEPIVFSYWVLTLATLAKPKAEK